ncbi:hypothetical protein FRC01_000272 [Tulasnella sp. 417]|nr:hypothetical protein FRC01_000272 [Tulasnella sp. 417]
MFVPRSVKAKPPAPKAASTAPKSKKKRDHGALQNAEESSSTAAKGKEQEVDQAPAQADAKDVQMKRELATLVELSLTNYGLWCTAQLRQILETQAEGWVSFETLIRHAPLLQNVEASPNELAQALRVYGTGRLELRLSLTTRSARSGAMFDVRRKDWEALKDQSLRDMSEEEWNARTIYVENIPPQHYKSKHELVSFFEACLGDPSEPIVVQDISFPPKEGRDESDTKCRGFAFIICNSSAAAEKATREWSWVGFDPRFRETLGGEPMDVEGEPNETGDKIWLAKRCGFRAITHRRWTELRDEYLAYRDVLIARLNARPEPEITTRSSLRIAPDKNKVKSDKGAQPQLSNESATVATNSIGPTRSDYPQGCLVFVRNIHPGTKKTTLKKVLSLPFTKKRHDGSEIDYIDWEKGLDSCYVRLSSCDHADRMVHYFTKYVQCQSEPLDDEITQSVTPDMFQKRITAKLVKGEREEIYWRKVPQKIKQVALDKSWNTEENLPQAEEAKPPRKRRKKTEPGRGMTPKPRLKLCSETKKSEGNMSNLNVNWSVADASPDAPQTLQQEGDLGYRYATDMPEGTASEAEKRVLITALINWMRKASWFAGTIGQRLKVVRVDTSCAPDGNQKKKTAEVECEVAVEEDMINAFGTLHGGCSGFLIDVCTTLPLIVLSDEKWGAGGITQGLNVVFHSPALA